MYPFHVSSRCHSARKAKSRKPKEPSAEHTEIQQWSLPTLKVLPRSVKKEKDRLQTNKVETTGHTHETKFFFSLIEHTKQINFILYTKLEL